MTSDLEIIKRIILQMEMLESRSSVDWKLVNNLADEALSIITDKQIGDILDPYIIKYLDDVDIREADVAYGAYQRKKILEIVGGIKG